MRRRAKRKGRNVAAKWTAEAVLEAIRQRHAEKKPLNYMAVVAEDEPLSGAARRYFGSWRKAIEAAGLDYDQIKKAARDQSVILPPGTWSRDLIIKKIKERAAAGLPLNPHIVQKEDSRLYSAATSNFGSWGKAVEAAGYDYLEYRKTRAWTQEKLLGRIREAYNRGADLSDNNVNALAPALYGAASAAFGSWQKAVEAAGLDYNLVSRTVRWSRTKILSLISDAVKEGRPLSAQAFPPGFAAAVKDLFGSWEKALEEAGYKERPWARASSRLKNHIREFRRALGLSETELGAKIGVTHRTISLLELGQYIDPRVSFAIKIARALGRSVEEVFELPQEEDPES